MSTTIQKPTFSGPVSADVNLPKQEEAVLTFWDAQKIFEKSMEQGEKPYSFYDGPPFATGTPHYGHILAGIIKDAIPRYFAMKGFKISRRFGWDCHGVPVEYEINKTHNIKNRQQVLDMGVDKYNALCRSIVQRYVGEWKKTVRRTGRWVNMEAPYFTMDVSFMQSVWWVFGELYKKGLIYDGYKVVPYSVGLSTALSNFEAGQDYRDVQDPAVTIEFKVKGEENTFILAWTTTPWTLPSNLALAVGAEVDYVKVKTEAGKSYILAKALVEKIFGEKTPVEVVAEMKGTALVGKTYEPLFNYFEKKVPTAFRVIVADHVTTDSGTGIVHMAPAFGEEDYFACKKAEIGMANPVDDDGCFTAEVPDYQGKMVKDADKEIIARLKAEGKLFKQETITHSYPFCYRSGTPLIYKAVSSWYVAVEKIKGELVKNNKDTTWVPANLRDGRFGNWLEDARDWAISRNRFWGTPIPIWKNKEGEIICVSSKAELEKLSGQTITDLHMEFLEKVTIPSPTGKSPLKRISDVLDCWFESGSMPYAQWGYPFENKKELEEGFPADFIAEGLDQTRGWFYTLAVLGTALFGKAPFKNVVVNGLLLAEDGKKMSKSLKNYPDPMEVLDKHGADALRLYLINSPAVKAQELKFSETGVKEITRQILLRWWNSYSFFINYANIDGFVPQGDYAKTGNLLDKWILSRLNTLVATVTKEMEAYQLYNVVPAIGSFIEDLTNTYIRYNRKHFWQEGMPEDKRLAYETLYHVLTTLSKVAAPFAPFMAETTYKNLSQANPKAKESVHLEAYPTAEDKFLNPSMEEAVKVMGSVVLLMRNFREKIKVKAKIPLLSMKVLHRSASVLENLKPFEPYMKEELNIRKIVYEDGEDNYLNISAKANFVALGKRLGGKMKIVAAGIAKFGIEEILKLEKGETITVEGEAIAIGDLEIRRAPKDGHPNLMSSQIVSIEVDTTVEREQILEGLSREIVRAVQAARKNADFQLDDRIALQIGCTGDMSEAAGLYQKAIAADTLATSFAIVAAPAGEHTEVVDVDGEALSIGITRQARG